MDGEKYQVQVDVDVTDSSLAEAKEKIKNLGKDKIKVDVQADDKGSINNADNKIKQVNQSAKSASKSAKSFGDTLKSALNIGSAAAITAKGFQAISQASRDAINAVKDFDKAIMDIRMATGDSYKEASNLVQSYNEFGKVLGATTTEVSQSADAWLRQGHSVKDTNTLIKDSMMLSKVAQLDSAEATEYLTSAMKGYKVAAEDVEGIVDKLTAVDLVSATDAGGLADGMSRVANTAANAGIEMDKLLGYLAATGEVTQESMSVIGNSFKTIFTRMSDIKAGKLELIDEDGTKQTLSDVETVLNGIGIKLRESDNEFRNFGDVLDDVAARWDSFSTVQQGAIAKAFAGTRQQERFRVLMKNYDKASEYMNVAADSAGSASEKFNAYLDSIEAKTKTLQATFESLSFNTISTQLVGDIIEASTAVLKFADDTNILEGALAGLAVAGAVKGFVALKTAITDIAVKMNNFSAALKMVKAGNIGTTEVEQLAKMTENLSKSQLKAVLSSEALSTEQRIAILTAHGMSTAEAEAALSSMGLATAEGAATATTFSLSGAIKGLWATLMANPLILVVAAVTAVVSAVSAYKQHLEEVRQAELDAGQAARDEVTNIISLYNAYSQANAAYKNNTGSHEELQSASSALVEALGIEQSKVEDLIQEYGSLDNALQQVTNDTLKDKLSDLTTGFSAAKKELQEAAKGGWFDSDEISVGFSEEYADALKKAGIDVIEREIQSYGAKIGTEYRVDLGDSSTYEGIVEMYDKLQKIRDALESEYGTEELADSSIYNSVNDKLNTFKEEYETVLGYIEDINKTVAQLSYNDYVSKNGVPETIEEYEKLRDSLIKTSKSNKDFVGSQEEIENSIKNTLADIPELADFIESYNQSLESTEDSAKGIVYTTEALETLTKKSKDASASVTKLNEVLNAQATGQSITIDNYNSDELKDYQSALEYVNGSMQLNADKAREIAKAKVEEQTAINNANKELREAQYMENINQIEEYKRQLSEKNNLTDEEIQKIQQQISACEEQNNGYLAECDQLDVLNASLKESISTYNEWKAAQSASESGDMFDDTLTAIKKIDDTLNNTKYENYGKVGREDYKTSLDLIIPDSVNAENEKAVQKYLKSVSDMFTYDNDKNRAGLNIANFCDKAVEQGLMVFDKKKKEYQVAGGKMMEDFAKGLNLSMPMVQAMFGEMEEYGAKFDWGDEIFDTFGDGIVAAQKQITDLESEIDSLHKQKAAGVDIDDSKIKKAKKELKELKKQKEELTQKATVNIETNMKVDSELEDAEAELDGWKTKLKDKDLDAEAKVEVKAKIEDAKDKIDKLQKKKDKLQEPTQVEIQASLGNIDSQIANLQTKVNNFSDKEYCAKFNISEEDAKAKVNELQGKINKLKDKKTKIEAYAETKNANKDLNSLDKKEIKDKDFTVSVIDNATTVINRINNMQLHDKNVTITTTEKTVKTGGNKVNGTAHVSGTAKASGDWRDKQGGETLVGELGREIVVNPHTGKWYTVGDNGAEFVNIPKNAIVFNHQQTEDLLSKGFVASRAVALANGTALASGTAMVTGGIKVSAAQSSTQRTYPKSKTKSSSNTKNSKSKSNSKNNEKSNEKKEKTALEKFQEWIGKLFDWIEIKIQRQSEKIDKYISRAENAQEAGKYGTSAKNYRKAINATTTQIVNERKASKKYNRQADKVVNKAVSMGVISQKQAASIKKQVQNGSMNIKKYGEKVREVIKDYQTWYEKSKDASKAVEELHNNIRKYIQDLKDMRDAQRQAKLDRLDTYTSIGTSGYAYTSQAQNSQLKFSNSELNKQDRAYNQEVKAVSKDVTSIGKSGTKSVNKALKTKDAKGKSKKAKAYRKALNNAKKAIKAKKPVSSADMKTIKAHSISVYNKLYAYNQSLDNLEDAKLEQATNFAATSAERFENIAQKYENKDSKTNSKIDLLRLKSSNATSVKGKNKNLDKVAKQYDQIVADDKAEIAEYKKQANSSAKTIKNKNGHGTNYKNLGKAGKKNVTAIINKAKNAAKSGKAIDASVISKLAEYYSKGYISQSFYEACINYNNAIEHRKEAEAQLEIDEQTAIQEKAAIGSEKFSNVEQKYTNKQNKNQSDKNKEAISQSIKTTKGMTLTATDYQTMINYSKAEQKIYSDEIAALNKTIQENLDSGYWTTSSQEYIDAMNSVRGYEEEVLNCNKEQEELNNEIAQLPYTVFDKAVGMIQSLKANFQSLLNIRTTRGIAKTSEDILSEIGYTNDEIAKQTERRQKLWEDYQTALYSEDGVYGGKDAETWLQEYYDTDTEINNLRADVESLNNEIAQLPYGVYERALELLDGIAKYNKSIADLTKAQGRDLSESDYLTQMQDNTNMITQYEEERIQAYSDYLKALADADGVYGGMTSDEWLTKYYELGTTINGLKSDNEDIKDALRDDVYWRTFERTHKAAKALADVLSGIADLIDDDMLYDKDGQFTDFGVAQMANTIKQYETARDEVGNYTKDIQNLNSLYAQGYYSQDEYNEKLNELQNSLFDSASAMKSYISTVIDMNKNLAKSELDALFKLIDARNDALTAKKNYYDYDKTIKSKTKDIQALQAQIAALEGVETAEGKAQKARLEADLSDAKDDLNDTIVNHSFELSKDALSELKDILQDEFDDRWDNMWQNLDEVQKLLKAANDLSAAQSATVGNAINQLLSFYGINPVSTDINQYIGYASGTKKVDKDRLAWTQENGQEFIVRKSDGAILTPLSRGDAVIPNDLSNNLFTWGKENPQEFADSLIRGIPDVPNVSTNQNGVNVEFSGNMLNVEGNVVDDELPKLKNLLDMAYKHTVDEMTKDARRKGIKV